MTQTLLTHIKGYNPGLDLRADSQIMKRLDTEEA